MTNQPELAMYVDGGGLLLDAMNWLDLLTELNL
jgi:hypothetical protein